MTPDRIADTWLGALAWAPGSQKCSGMMPAFRPNPVSVRKKSAFRAGIDAVPATSGTKSKDPVTRRQSAKRPNRVSVPKCVAMK
jgi:hypothetical protein